MRNTHTEKKYMYSPIVVGYRPAKRIKKDGNLCVPADFRRALNLENTYVQLTFYADGSVLLEPCNRRASLWKRSIRTGKEYTSGKKYADAWGSGEVTECIHDCEAEQMTMFPNDELHETETEPEDTDESHRTEEGENLLSSMRELTALLRVCMTEVKKNDTRIS